jgi:hypothetical protein
VKPILFVKLFKSDGLSLKPGGDLKLFKILFDIFDLIILFQNYQNIISEAFSHVLVINDNYNIFTYTVKLDHSEHAYNEFTHIANFL